MDMPTSRRAIERRHIMADREPEHWQEVAARRRMQKRRLYQKRILRRARKLGFL